MADFIKLIFYIAIVVICLASLGNRFYPEFTGKDTSSLNDSSISTSSNSAEPKYNVNIELKNIEDYLNTRQIDVLIENNSNEEDVYVAPSYFTMADSDGFVLKIDGRTRTLGNSSSVTLQPGQKTTFSLIFVSTDKDITEYKTLYYNTHYLNTVFELE